MDLLKYRHGLFRKALILFGATAIVMVSGLILWADNPGPRPDPDVGVTSFHPRGTTPQQTNITINFSNGLVSVEEVSRPTSNVPVVIEPKISGLARWKSPDVLVIYPDAPLKPATQYKVTVKAGGGYVNGNRIKRNQTFEFQTPPLTIKVAGYRAQGVRDARRQARLIIDLVSNYPVSLADLVDNVRIEGVEDATQKSLSLDESYIAKTSDPDNPDLSKEHRLVTEAYDLAKDKQQYRLILDKDFRCPECGEGLSENYEYEMTVGNRPQMELWIDRVTAQKSGKQGAIEVRFSTGIATEEVRERVTLDPPQKFTVEGNWRGGILRGNFEPGKTYTVRVNAGVMSREGTLMERDFEGIVKMGDLVPLVRFTTPGVYMPRDGKRLLEIETVNIDTLSLEIEQIFANNLVGYLASGSDNATYWGRRLDLYGRNLMVHDFGLEGERNEELTSSVDVGRFLGDTLRGVFSISVRDQSSRWTSDTRHVMLTDIGLLARMSGDYLMVWANTLSEARPIKKAEVKLFSRSNQLLVEGKTNSKGVIVFDDLADHVLDHKPFLITVEKDNDLAYLRLDNSRLPVSDFDVSGRPYLSRGYEAFVYFDRGVYRPGETTHLISIVRGRDGIIPESFPYLIKITDPQGRKFREYRMDAGQVLSGLDIELPGDIPTGRYSVSVRLSEEDEFGRGTFLVEEFVPDRIKVTIETDKEQYQIDENIDIVVTGRMLYGPPAAKHRVSTELTLQPDTFRPSGYSAYTFSDGKREFAQKQVKLSDSVLSDSGTVTYTYSPDKNLRPPAQLKTRIWSTVSELGGRAVSASHEIIIHPYEMYLGIKTNLESYAKVGEPVLAHIVVLGSDGTPQTLDSVKVVFSRLVYNSMMRREKNGSYRFVSEETEEPIDSTWVSVGQSGCDVEFTPEDYGRYRIVVHSPDGGHSTATRFYASGWGRVPWSMAQPDRLDLDLDKTTYAAGSKAKLQIRAPFSGKLLLTLENQSVQRFMTVEMPDNTAEIEIPVERGFAPNVYITGTLIRPASQITKHTPARAFGMVPLVVVPKDRRLEVVLEAPETVRPYDTLKARVSTGGGENTLLTVAAVDAGILQLTGFETPDPFEFFCGKRRPGLDPYDIYALVYPELEQQQSHLSPPGGMSALRQKRHLNPFAARRVNVVALWSGVVTADTAGVAEVAFEIPEFSGQLVLMVIAVDGDRFGSQSTSVMVGNKIVLQESFPRFVAPGDIVDGLTTIYNGMDTAATISVACDLNGPAELLSPPTQSLELESKTEGIFRFKFKADPIPGIVGVNLSATAGEEQSRSSFELSNRPGQPLTVEFGSGVATADSSAVFQLPDRFVPGTDEYVVRTSSLAAVGLMRNLEYLLKYPYGCIEQTTSGVYPLLYFDELAKVVDPALYGSKSHEYYIAAGIDKLLRFQRSDGSFSYWPDGDYMNNWSAVYAADFMVEAHNAGYEIESNAYKRVLGFLKNMARGKKYTEIKIEHRIYACYAMAKAGKLDKKLVNYLTELNTIEIPSYSRYQLAASLAFAGDVEHAKELVPIDIQPELFEPSDGGNFTSGVRTNAILLDLLLTVDPRSPSVFALARSLVEEARLNRWYNTQSTAFALTSLGKYFARAENPDFVGELRIEGNDSYSIDTSDFKLITDGLGGRTVRLSIEGEGSCYYFWQASGVPTSPVVKEFSRGIRISREYVDSRGNGLDLTSLPLGSRIVGHITVEATDKSLRNVVINDLLPAAFEIENQRLATSMPLPWPGNNASKPQYQDIRDDRLLLFTDLSRGRTKHFYYALRVIAKGEYSIPPVAAECMYNPLIAGASSSGALTVGE